MNSKARLISFLLLCFGPLGFSQKIKYKDLFVLLNSKQYAESETYLKKYLKENDDNPNAYLFMGIIYQDKASKLDILKDTQAMVMNLDSAVYFYDKANKGITEKELSKHDEYYEMYNRRDLRTGKFGVNISDVKLDLEAKLKLKDRARTIVILKTQFLAAENFYIKSQNYFQKIQKPYANQKEFYLRADDSLLFKLGRLAQLYDSCHINFNDYKATLQSLGKSSYNQDIDPVEITDFKKDGATKADFYRDDLKIWDFKRWALGSKETIEKEIRPIQEQLVGMDAEINKMHQKLKKDSISVTNDVNQLTPKLDFPALRKIDPQPLPLQLFQMKLAELVYGSQVVEDRSIKDSTNVFLHVQAVRKELQLVKKVDSLAGMLNDRNLDEEIENYKHFVATAYGTSAVLKGTIKSTKELYAREVLRRENDLKRKNESLRWIVSGLDSIPLFAEVPAASRYKPLILQEKFTMGLVYKDSLAMGYFNIISPSRKPDIKSEFNVDKLAFKKRNVPSIKALSVQDEKGLVYFFVIYSEANTAMKYPGTVVKIYRAEGLAWAVNYTFDARPELINFSPELFELTVKTKSSLGEISTLIFDKNGKVMK